MNVVLIVNSTKERLGELLIQTQPHTNEWVEFEGKVFAIHRVIHSPKGIKLLVIPVR